MEEGSGHPKSLSDTFKGRRGGEGVFLRLFNPEKTGVFGVLKGLSPLFLVRFGIEIPDCFRSKTA